jgi:hypothetical protein
MRNPKETGRWRSWLAMVPTIGVALLPRFT